MKEIKTVAKVNQVETEKMIQDLISEKQRLLKELENAKSTGRSLGYTPEGRPTALADLFLFSTNL